MPVRSSLVVTAAEAVELLRGLEPQLAADLNERRFNYTAALVGSVSPGKPGATLLYDVIDLVLVRLLLQLEALISRPVARAVVPTVWPQLRALLERARPVSAVLVVPIADKPPWLRQPPVITSIGEARKRNFGGVQIELSKVIAGVREGVQCMRSRNETVRQWADVSPSTATYRLQELREESETWSLTLR